MYRDYKEIFKNLRQMQDQLWQDSLSSFPGAAFPRDLTDWQQKTLDKEMTKLSDQIARSMQKSIETQQQLWSHWFGELGVPGPASPEKKSTPAVSPTKKSEKVAAKTKSNAGQALQSNDDLKQISGIGPGLEKKLKEAGIVTHEQLAELGDEGIADLEETVIRFSGRIKREQWVEQARKLIS